MPGVTASFTGRRPEIEAAEPATLGGQLLRRRRELGHRRVDAVQSMGISWKSLMWWERNEREPLDRFWPTIITYLGREPWSPPDSLSEQLQAERRRRGLARFEAAAALGVDDTTYWWWESGRREPSSARTRSLVARFLGGE